MKMNRMQAVAEQAAAGLHEGAGVCHGGTVFDRHALGGEAWRFVDVWRLPPGAAIGPHRHDQGRELYVILDGTGRMTTNGQTVTVVAGDLVLNEPGDWHALENASETDLRVLVTAVVEEAGVPLYTNLAPSRT